jgi:hypothetical protein
VSVYVTEELTSASGSGQPAKPARVVSTRMPTSPVLDSVEAKKNNRSKARSMVELREAEK